MSENRTRGRRASQRAFRPTLDGKLESRMLLSGVHHAPPIKFQAANGGRAVIITDSDGAQFEVTVTSILQGPGPQITAGIVVAHPMSGGRVQLKAFGTTSDSVLAINPLIKERAKGDSHLIAAGQAGNDSILHVGSIKIVSGKINSIVGYHSADLSGPLTASAPTPVNRIAFESLGPGASITVGGDLNTLDVLHGVFLDRGPGITVGRDLNWFNTGGDFALSNGASLIVGRDIGLTAQPAKGTGPAGQGGLIQGNLVIATGSKIVVGRSIVSPIVVNGNGFGLSQVFVGTPISNFVFRPGAIVVP